MNYNDLAPADPIIFPHPTNDPSSPPSIEESQQGSFAIGSSSTGLPRLPQVKLRIKIGRPTPNSAIQIMDSIAQYGNTEDDGHETSGDESSFRFSGVNANAVRSSLNLETNGSEAAVENESNPDESATEQETPKKELRERKRTSDSGSKKGSARKGAKRGRKPKAEKEEAKDDEEEDEEKEKKKDESGDDEDGEEEEEVYEVERILAHAWADNGELLYKVKWVGYDAEFDTFEPVSALGSAKARIAEYRKSLPVETRRDLEEGEKKNKKKKRGRPSASKSGKRPRSDSLPMPSDESDPEEEKEEDDDDYKMEKKAGPSSATPTSKSRGRPPKSKGALKLFVSPKSTGPPKKKPFLENRQGWLNESDSDSDADSRKEKKEKDVGESSVPRGRKRGGREAASEENTTVTNGTRHSSRGVVASAAAIEGVYRHDNGEMDVVITEGRSQRVVGLREAFDVAGFGLVQFLADRFQFQA